MKKSLYPFMLFPLVLGGCGMFRIPDFIKTKVLHQEDTDISMTQFMKLPDTIKSYTLDLAFDGAEYLDIPAKVFYNVKFVKETPYKEIYLEGYGEASKRLTKTELLSVSSALAQHQNFDDIYPTTEPYNDEYIDLISDDMLIELVEENPNAKVTKDGDLYVVTYRYDFSPSYLKVKQSGNTYEEIEQINNKDTYDFVPCDFFLSIDDVFANYLKYSYSLFKYDNKGKCYHLRTGLLNNLVGIFGEEGFEIEGDLYFKDNLFDKVHGCLSVEGKTLVFDGVFSDINSTTINK